MSSLELEETCITHGNEQPLIYALCLGSQRRNVAPSVNKLVLTQAVMRV